MESNKLKNGTRHSEVKKPRYKNIIHLWEFLLELLANENLSTIISWSRRENNEFKLQKPEEVARRWGILRRKKGMTYAKLSRSLRFYYGQGIIQKVPWQRFTYKFDKLPYKYEPGVTRSLHHELKMAASIHEGEETTSDKSTPFQINASPSSVSEQPAFPHTGIPWEKCISWSLVPMPALPVQPRSQSAPQFTAQMCNIVDLSRVTTSPATVPIPDTRPDFHDSTAKSIPVSVIKRVVPNPTDKLRSQSQS